MNNNQLKLYTLIAFFIFLFCMSGMAAYTEINKAENCEQHIKGEE